MFSSKINSSLLFAALVGTTRACGPCFPATIIDREEAILAAPHAPFAVSLRRIPGPAAGFQSVAPAAGQSPVDQTFAAERADLAAAGATDALAAQYQHCRANHTDLPPDCTGLPAEFADYHAAACALARGDAAAALRSWQDLLSRPAGDRKYKSTWAAFMLGRTVADPAEARTYFQMTRQLARAGFPDTLGLAAASLGWEAKTWLDAKDPARAAELYLAQSTTGDDTAANSLRFVATRVLAGDNLTLNAFAADPRLREVITALVLAQREEEMLPQFTEGEPNIRTGATTRWLAALERAGVTDAPQSARLALAAYRAGQFTLTGRWLDLASPDDDLALWLRAKLALRDGNVDLATTHLSTLVRRNARPAGSLGEFRFYREYEMGPVDTSVEIRAELGALKLARRDYAEALDLLLQGRCWEDAAYVAERVLTADELKSFLATQPAVPVNGNLRHLLARRLVRLERLDEARAYFPAALLPDFERFRTLLLTGRDTAQPAAIRAAALMDAARLLKDEGMALRGAELEPDFAIWEGNFPVGLGLAQREKLPPHLRATPDERARVGLETSGHNERFHYRYTAADLAWAAIELMPSESNVTARALVEAGGWLKARDPRAANRFYQALVRRCSQTPLGTDAARKHWFPNVKL